MRTKQQDNRKGVVRMPRNSEPLTEADFQVGDAVRIAPQAHLYRKALLCFAGEASISKGPKLLRRLQKEKALLITPPRSFEGLIREKNTMPGKDGFPAFTFYHVEVNMEGHTFDFITTADHFTGRNCS
jgi:hypothetical protein